MYAIYQHKYEKSLSFEYGYSMLASTKIHTIVAAKIEVSDYSKQF
jgi:hypothetical protein